MTMLSIRPPRMSGNQDPVNFLLTAQEKQVLSLIAEGDTNKQIASALNMSPSAVRRHTENILSKLHLKNRIQAAVYLAKMGSRFSEAKKSE
ncbi:MAG TPA: LuxR C-terminal-related transcriptional regulator [Candidatus Binatia bacterium]